MRSHPSGYHIVVSVGKMLMTVQFNVCIVYAAIVIQAHGVHQLSRQKMVANDLDHLTFLEQALDVVENTKHLGRSSAHSMNCRKIIKNKDCITTMSNDLKSYGLEEQRRDLLLGHRVIGRLLAS
ncbi:hypothetical protein BCR43DRAFT_518002 [Syncephalastrum racemosum]|uniref:Uncharacterized protein n=1 Tax=Syncephalastrum racemosum TaxID=13706 RepID=A0A1X2H2H1_SYNRA|nr:hypothetical protein BCR43DRAFT_518002 [Syncephalastrum racemosum]